MLQFSWTPPGRNCGACGMRLCSDFEAAVVSGEIKPEACPFFKNSTCLESTEEATGIPTTDIHGREVDFVLTPLKGEESARKIILPFRPDLVDLWGIGCGDIVTGRPMGAGCPVQHVLRVIGACPVSGVLTCHVVGPHFSRGKDVFDVKAYHVIGFEGDANVVRREPVLGMRQWFLPAYCMMNLAHTGVVNMVIGGGRGLHVRVEDVRL